MLRFVKIILTLIGCLIVGTQAAGYDGYKIYEITPTTRLQCDLLHKLSQNEQDYDFLALSKIPKTKAVVMIAPPTEAQLLSFFKVHDFKSYKIINENVGKTIESEFNRNRLLCALKPSFTGKGRLSTERYYTHQEINNYIEDLAARYPKRAYVKTFGKSYEGRLIKTITISNGDGRPNKKVIFVDGGFHAREWISPAAVLYVIEQLVERFEQHTDLLKDHDWVILPVVNPDGYEYTQTSVLWRMWRKTRQPYKYAPVCNGADPNRNFDFHWNEEGASSWPCSEMYAGPKAFSEPEAIIVRDLMHTLGERGVMYLTIHSFGSFMLYPWGWTTDLPPTWEDLDEVGRAGADAIFEATGEVYTVGTSTNVLYIAAGASDDYGYISGFPISITMELPHGGLTGFDPPASQIDATVKETWIGIHAMAKKVIEKY